MGAHLVSQVLAHWTHVSDRAFRVLVRMAVTALDQPKDGRPPKIYHGGRDLLAMALRTDKGTPQTRYRAVKRAVAELIEEGAIKHLASGWAGQKAVYRLTLERAGSPAIDDPDDGSMGGQFSPPEGGPTSPPMGGQNDQERGAAEAPPRNQEDQEEELAEEKTGFSTTTSHPSRATPKPTPDRCPKHHIRLKPRADGEEACAFCRAGIPAMTPEASPDHEPDPPPTRPLRCGHGQPITGKEQCADCLAEGAAPVIDLSTRRTA